MAVQITGRQIANSAVDVTKLDLSSGTFDFTSAILQVATPSDTDAANRVASKGYVDGVAQGLDIKDSCAVATTANITLSGTQTIDGISVTADSRVLVKDQSTQSENGIYICAAGAWSRAADFAAGASEAGAFTFVEQGTVNGDNGFVCTSDKGSDVVGTNNIVFSQFSGAGQVTAGNALTKSGNTLNVAVDDSSIEISSDALQVKSGGITNAMLAGSIANGKLANSSVSLGGITVALGGSDATPAFDLSDATNYPTSSLSGTISNAQLAGSIANAKLANSSVSLGGVSVALGASDATPAFDLADATNYPTSSLVGTITNAQLAGNIANDKLEFDGIILGGVTISLGQSDSTPAFDLSDATNYPTSSLVGTISNAQLAGSIANAKLANSSVSFGGISVALGASDATPAFDLTDAINYPTSSLSGTISNAQLAGSIQAGKLLLGDALLDSSNSLDVKLDGSTLAKGTGGLSVAGGGIGTTQLAADCVTNAKIADDAIKTENLDFAGFFQAFDASGSASSFELAGAVDLEFKQFFTVTVNGLIMEYKDTPDAQDNYKIDNGGSGGVARIVFGANLAANDRVTIRGFINN